MISEVYLVKNLKESQRISKNLKESLLRTQLTADSLKDSLGFFEILWVKMPDTGTGDVVSCQVSKESQSILKNPSRTNANSSSSTIELPISVQLDQEGAEYC